MKDSGLTKSDLDFEQHTIRISHQLLKGKDGYYIDEPKTKNGVRNVPMSEETKKAFYRVLKRKQKPRDREIDGYRHFLFLSSSGLPMGKNGKDSRKLILKQIMLKKHDLVIKIGIRHLLMRILQ